MGCLSDEVKGAGVQQVSKLTPEQEQLVALLGRQARPAVAGVPMRATIPGMEFAPGGPSGLQQQAFQLAGQLPGLFEGGIGQMMQPVGQFAREGFRQESIPAIMAALGGQGAARSSGAAGILGREARNLELGLASQFAPMQFGLQQARVGLPSQLAQMGGLQQSFPEAQRQFALQRFMAGVPEASPRLGLLGPAFTSAYDTAVQQGHYSPGLLSQMLGFGGAVGGQMAASDARLKDNIESIEDALEKLNQIDGKIYNFKWNNPDNKDVGVLAQELEQILPEAIVERNGVKYVKYEAVIALLVSAVKQLARKVG